MGLTDLLKGSDETATKMDESGAVSFSDEGVDPSKVGDESSSGNDELVDQNVNQQGDLGDTWGTLKSGVTRGTKGAAGAVGGAVGSGITKAAVIGGGAYALNEAVNWKQAEADMKQAKSRQKAYKQLQKRLQEIENNDNLSPEQKQAAKERAREMFRDMWGSKNGGGGGGGGGGLFASLRSALGLGGGGSGPASSMMGKFFLGLIAVSAIWVGPRLIKSVKGGS